MVAIVLQAFVGDGCDGGDGMHGLPGAVGDEVALMWAAGSGEAGFLTRWGAWRNYTGWC